MALTPATQVRWMKLTLIQGTVLTQLAIAYNPFNHQCNPSIKTLALWCHCSRASVKRAVRQLVRMGAVTVMKGTKGTSNRYDLHLPERPKGPNRVVHKDIPVDQQLAGLNALKASWEAE